MDQSFQELINELDSIRFRIFKSQELFECLSLKLTLGAGPVEDSIRQKNDAKIDLLRTEVEMLKVKNNISLMEQDHEKIYDHLVSTFA